MQEAPNAERIYDFFRQNGNGPRGIATFHLLLLPSLLRCLLLLLILLLNIPYEGFSLFSNFLPPEMLLRISGFEKK